MSQGDTSEEAEENLVEATELTLAHLKANNLPIPKAMSISDLEDVEILEAMIDNEIVVNMPPKKRYSINLKVET